jgi:hypothetical protein
MQREGPDHDPFDRDDEFRTRVDSQFGRPRDETHPGPPAGPPAGPPEDRPRRDDAWRAEAEERARRDPAAIRAEDTEPYMALQYVARLFKIAAMVVVVALVAEVVAGIILEGAGAILPLLAEVIRGVVLASILWGAGDLTLLLIDVGHDVRAARVLLGRLSARSGAGPGDRER